MDDEEIVLEAGQEMIEYLGYDVILAENGKKAAEIYKRKWVKIAMVLLDMVIPLMGCGEPFDKKKEMNNNAKVLL